VEDDSFSLVEIESLINEVYQKTSRLRRAETDRPARRGSAAPAIVERQWIRGGSLASKERHDVARRGEAESHDDRIARLVHQLVDRVGREARGIADIRVARRRVDLVDATGEGPFAARDRLQRRMRARAAVELRLRHRLLDGRISADVATLAIEAERNGRGRLLEDEFRRDRLFHRAAVGVLRDGKSGRHALVA